MWKIMVLVSKREKLREFLKKALPEQMEDYPTKNRQGLACICVKSYPILLKEILKLDIVRNYGINGSTIADGENPMYIRYQDMSDEADIVSVLAGTNDFGREEIEISPLGTNQDKQGNTVYGALDILCRG